MKKSLRLLIWVLVISLMMACLSACGTTPSPTTEPTATLEPTVEPTLTPTATPVPATKPTPEPEPEPFDPSKLDYEYEVIDEEAKTAMLHTVILPEGTNNKEVKEIVLPDTIHGYKVVAIGWDVFGKIHVGGLADSNWLQKVTIPATVEYFQDNVFRTAYACTEIIFEDESNIKYIADSAFRVAPWEKARAMENDGFSVVNGIVTGIWTLGDVVIPDGVRAISGGPFAGTSFGPDVDSITIPDSVVEIRNLMESVNEDAVIICSRNSYAAKYAEENNLNVKYTD